MKFATKFKFFKEPFRTLPSTLAFLTLAAATFNASALATSTTNAVSENVSKNDANGRTLEDDFFEILWRCDSPILVERNDAEDELTRRFAEFEPIWQDRTFLTDGEISAEANWRFGRAETRFRADVERRTLASFRTNSTVGPVETSDDGATRPCRVRIDWNERARIVYLAPDWRSFRWRDPVDGSVWRSRDRFSSPEIVPEFDATSLEIDATLERVADDDVSPNETQENGAFEVLLGADFRELDVPFDVPFDVPIDNGANDGAAFDSSEPSEPSNSSDSASFPNSAISSDAPKSRPTQTLQSGDLTLSVSPTRRRENGETTAFLRLDFAEAFDAFDSHRVWFDADDFSAKIEKNGDERDGDNDSDGGDGGEPRRFAPIRRRTRARSVRGVSLELDFSETATAAFDQAVRAGVSVRLCARVPRFFLFARLPFRAESPNANAKVVDE